MAANGGKGQKKTNGVAFQGLKNSLLGGRGCSKIQKEGKLEVVAKVTVYFSGCSPSSLSVSEI